VCEGTNFYRMEGSRKASKVIFVMREYAKKNNVAGTQ
jgi:hypothetical protein